MYTKCSVPNWTELGKKEMVIHCIELNNTLWCEDHCWKLEHGKHNPILHNAT